MINCIGSECTSPKCTSIERPSGLIRKPVDRRETIENAELRLALEQAVDFADLNLTERLALNSEFFPNGDGFNIVPLDTDVLELTTYYKKGKKMDYDQFNQDAVSIAAKYGDSFIQKHSESKKSSFQTNLDHAILKLRSVFMD